MLVQVGDLWRVFDDAQEFAQYVIAHPESAFLSQKSCSLIFHVE